MRQSELLAALSHALDLTEGQPVGHAERTCLIALRVADELRLDDEDRHALVMASLLKDVGCSSSAARMCQLFGTDDITLKANGKLVDWQRPADVVRYTARHVEAARRIARARRTLAVLRELSDAGSEIVEARCDRGASIVRALGCPEAARRGRLPARRALERQGQPAPAGGRRDRAAGPHRRAGAVGRRVQRRPRPSPRRARWCASAAAAGSSPRWPTRSSRSATTTALWDDLRARRPGRAGARPRPAGARRACADEAALDRVCEAFADVIDAKSPFTARHSRGVAAYALLIGETLGLARDAAARHPPRGAAARHRQARRPELDPRQAGQADRRGVRRDAPASALHGGDPARRRRRSRRSPRWPPRTTSGWTAAATTAACAPATCRSARAPWPSPTSSRP